MKVYSFSASTNLEFVDERYEKLKNEFINWCTGRHAKDNKKELVICFGCMNRAKTFEEIKHDNDCCVAKALE